MGKVGYKATLVRTKRNEDGLRPGGMYTEIWGQDYLTNIEYIGNDSSEILEKAGRREDFLNECVNLIKEHVRRTASHPSSVALDRLVEIEN